VTLTQIDAALIELVKEKETASMKLEVTLANVMVVILIITELKLV